MKDFFSFLLISLPLLRLQVKALSSVGVRNIAAQQISTIADDPSSPLKQLPSESQVLQAAQRFMENTGYFNPMDESLFADDFVFRGPVIGPLNKKDYKEVLEYFSVYKAFPDIDPNCFGFSIDPDDPLRVWYNPRATGTYSGNPLGGPVGSFVKPDGRKHRGSTETRSLAFDEKLKARLLTAGYVSDRFEENSTTDGIGLSFGVLKTIGLSVPSGVGNPILRFIQLTNDPLVNLGISPKAVSDEEDVPKWWKSEKRGAEP